MAASSSDEKAGDDLGYRATPLSGTQLRARAVDDSQPQIHRWLSPMGSLGVLGWQSIDTLSRSRRAAHGALQETPTNFCRSMSPSTSVTFSIFPPAASAPARAGPQGGCSQPLPSHPISTASTLPGLRLPDLWARAWEVARRPPPSLREPAEETLEPDADLPWPRPSPTTANSPSTPQRNVKVETLSNRFGACGHYRRSGWVWLGVVASLTFVDATRQPWRGEGPGEYAGTFAVWARLATGASRPTCRCP